MDILLRMLPMPTHPTDLHTDMDMDMDILLLHTPMPTRPTDRLHHTTEAATVTVILTATTVHRPCPHHHHIMEAATILTDMHMDMGILLHMGITTISHHRRDIPMDLHHHTDIFLIFRMDTMSHRHSTDMDMDTMLRHRIITMDMVLRHRQWHPPLRLLIYTLRTHPRLLRSRNSNLNRNHGCLHQKILVLVQTPMVHNRNPKIRIKIKHKVKHKPKIRIKINKINNNHRHNLRRPCHRQHPNYIVNRQIRV
mmetsp:Transcript_5666/g.8473  ORF Transcript_5666/g.8473 Transcript_5666/m.8473 type:complete len:252 (+) Transcript_5666:187-942(+)